MRRVRHSRSRREALRASERALRAHAPPSDARCACSGAQVPAARWASSSRGFSAASRLRSTRNTLLFCGATFVGGIGVFAGAYLLHTRYDMYGSNRYVQRTRDDAVLSAVQARTRQARDATAER
jgi:hypothetical protein